MAINVGACVKLTKAFGGAVAGSEGNITFIDGAGNITVTIRRGPACNPVTIVLPPAPPSYFAQPCTCA